MSTTTTRPTANDAHWSNVGRRFISPCSQTKRSYLISASHTPLLLFLGLLCFLLMHISAFFFCWHNQKKIYLENQNQHLCALPVFSVCECERERSKVSNCVCMAHAYHFHSLLLWMCSGRAPANNSSQSKRMHATQRKTLATAKPTLLSKRSWHICQVRDRRLTHYFFLERELKPVVTVKHIPLAQQWPQKLLGSMMTAQNAELENLKNWTIGALWITHTQALRKLDMIKLAQIQDVTPSPRTERKMRRASRKAEQTTAETAAGSWKKNKTRMK